MTPRARRTALLAAGAALLLLALAFLFVRTHASGYKEQAQAVALLRELRDADTRWEADGLRLANDLGARQASAPDRGPVVARVLQELERLGTNGLPAAELAQLRAGMASKQQAWEALRSAHARSLEALGAAREALSATTAESAALRARDPRSGERIAAFLGQVEQMRTVLRLTDIENLDAHAREFASVLAVLPAAAQAIDARLGATAEKARQAVEGLLAARASEAQAWRKFSFITVGARADLLSQTLARASEAALDDKDRWRAYLFAYAIALLIGVGYLGSRVSAAQSQLREANELLEARVAERTRELEQALAKLRESEAQLVQTEKMSSLGQLVAGVAHEINTPLAYVKNSVDTVRVRMPELHDAVTLAGRLLELLRHEAADPDQLQSTFDQLAARLDQIREHQVLEDLDSLSVDGLHGIEQISELVGNLRSFSRLDRSKIASFNVNDGVNAALLIAKPHLRKVDVEKRLGEVASITCSPSQVNQVLLNIITNAAQAMDKARGVITVTTRADGPDHVAIEIADNGKGIARENLTRIFDPFYTTKAPGQGTGLGLSIAYKIVSQHGGQIDVLSEVGVGTTFVVSLPVRPSPEVAAEAGAAEPARSEVA
jgi:two-component system NtrC family sensor kinase